MVVLYEADLSTRSLVESLKVVALEKAPSAVHEQCRFEDEQARQRAGSHRHERLEVMSPSIGLLAAACMRRAIRPD